MRAYTRPIWLLPRAVSPALPVFLLVTVYWGLGDELDVLHVTSIAGKGGRREGKGRGCQWPVGRSGGGRHMHAGVRPWAHHHSSSFPASPCAGILFMSNVSTAYGRQAVCENACLLRLW